MRYNRQLPTNYVDELRGKLHTMARPRLTEGFYYYTAAEVMLRLGLSCGAFNGRLKQGILPTATYVNAHGLRFFDDEWLSRAKAIIRQQRRRSQRRRAGIHESKKSPEEATKGA